jgi:soluble lytic murein transglycosylase
MLRILERLADRVSDVGARAISRLRAERVKAPSPPVRASERTDLATSGSSERSGCHARCVLVVVAATLTLTAVRVDARAPEAPLCDWLSAIGGAAQALADGHADASETAARRALLARPRGAAAGRGSAALGVALAARGDPTEAASALEVALAPSTAAGRAHLSLIRGEALLSIGDAPAAARLFAEAGRRTDLAVVRRARLGEARALLAANLPDQALPAAEDLLRTDPTNADALLAGAIARRTLGDDARAVAALRSVWLAADLPQAREAGDELAAWRSAGGPVPPPTAEDHLARADRLLAAAHPDEALAEIAAAANADPPARPDRLSVFRALAALSLGRFPEAERTAAPLADAEDLAIRRAARWTLARAAARDGRLDEAAALYASVSGLPGDIPGLPAWRQRDLTDETAYLAAWIHYDAGAFARAAAALDAFARAHPRSPRAEDALWFAAWSRYRAGDLAGADSGFARLGRTALAGAGAYWQARLARTPDRQRALYRRTLDVTQDGWYAFLARARLAALGATAPRPRARAAGPLPETLPAAAAARLAVAVELLGLGLQDPALEELRDLARLPAVRPAAAAVAQLAAFAGDAELPFRMARDHLAPTRRTARWAHPEPYADLLPGRAHAFGVDPALLLSVMRRESSFRPAIRSFAGAEGLLQLRPVTAERLAAVMGVAPGLGGRLADPEVSVSLGAHYLGLLGARFGDPAVAIAAYNAGPRPAAEWATARAGMPLDAWVECIPYRETRQYVKIVLADWDVYRSLEGADAPPLDPAQPVKAPAPGVAF